MKKQSKGKKKGLAKFIGKAPGTGGYIGEKNREKTEIEIIDYSKDKFEIHNVQNVEEAFKFKTTDQITWINVNGLNLIDEIEKLGKYFGLHPLVLEDIVDTSHRPKVEEYENYIFVVLKMLYFNKQGDFVIEHISMVIGDTYVLTFQEVDEDIFHFIRERIANPESRLRRSKADYLAFAIIDTIVDNYFAIIEDFAERLELLEDQLFDENPLESSPKDIQIVKKEILRIRRNVFPIREVISKLEKTEHPVVEEKTRNFFRDIYDHIIHINENIEIYRDMVWGLMDMYMTSVSNKMNNIMKVLTIIATIFIPLTFVVGVYGMNFEYMPELKYRYGYYWVWGIMLLLFVGMLFFFRRKRWL